MKIRKLRKLIAGLVLAMAPALNADVMYWYCYEMPGPPFGVCQSGGVAPCFWCIDHANHGCTDQVEMNSWMENGICHGIYFN